METCNFKFETSRARKWTMEQLLWSLKDAKEARDAAEELSRAGYVNNWSKYADQVHVYLQELNRRQKA